MSRPFLAGCCAVVICFSDPSSDAWADECRDILMNGIFNTSTYQNERELKQDIRKILTWDMERRKTEHVNASGSYKELLGASIGANFDRKTFDRLKQHLKRDEQMAWRSAEYTLITTTIADKNIVAAWAGCIGGIRASASESDGQSFIFRLDYQPKKPSDGPVKIRAISAINGNVVGTQHIRDGVMLDPFTGLSQMFEHINCRKGVKVVVDFYDAPSKEATCEAIPCPPAPNPRWVSASGNLSHEGSGGGWRHTGGDREMKTKNDRHTDISGSASLTHDGRYVYLDYSFEHKEGRHNWTQFNLQNRMTVFTAPADTRIVGLNCTGGPSWSFHFPQPGQLHHYVPNPRIGGSFFTRLEHKFDLDGGNDHPAQGVSGAVSFQVQLQDPRPPCPQCP